MTSMLAAQPLQPSCKGRMGSSGYSRPCYYSRPCCKGECAVLLQIEKTSQKLGLAHPHDRHGAPLKDRASSAELDAALEAYRQACARACEDVRDRLRSLARSLMVLCRHPSIYLSSHVAPCHVAVPGAISGLFQLLCTGIPSPFTLAFLYEGITQLVCNNSIIDLCVLHCRACSRSWYAHAQCPSLGLR